MSQLWSCHLRFKKEVSISLLLVVFSTWPHFAITVFKSVRKRRRRRRRRKWNCERGTQAFDYIECAACTGSSRVSSLTSHRLKVESLFLKQVSQKSRLQINSECLQLFCNINNKYLGKRQNILAEGRHSFDLVSPSTVNNSRIKPDAKYSNHVIDDESYPL